MDSDEEMTEDADKNNQNTTLKKVIKTIFLALCWVCLGMMMEVAGPTLIDLKARTRSTYEEVASAIAGQNIGYIVGAVLGGVLVDKLGLFCEMMVALSLDVSALATITIPWVPRTEIIWVFCLIQGVGGGVLNTSGMKLIFNMWLDKAASPMHVLHGGYGIGSFIIPLIANPFLAVPSVMTDNTMVNKTHLSSPENFTDGNITLDLNTNTNEIQYLKESRIEYAYLIPGLITISLSLVFHVYHFIGRKDRILQRAKSFKRTPAKPLKFRQMLNPATCAGGDTVYGILLFVLLFLFYFNCVGGERLAGTFLRTYSIDNFGFSVDEGSYINTAFWISFTVGRYVGFLAATWIPIRILILIESGGLLISTICHVSLSGSSRTAFWVIVQPLGFFTGPFFPSGMGWGNYHLKMTGTAIALLQLGGSAGPFVYLRLGGFLYDTYGTRTYLYCLLGYGIAMFVVSVLLDLVAGQHGKTSANTDNEYADATMEEVNEDKISSDQNSSIEDHLI